MSDRSPWRNPADWFLNAAVGILVGALALWLAVHLLEQIWGWLLVIAGVTMSIWIAVAVLRFRRQRW